MLLEGVTVADTRRSVRILETSHPPTYYLHPDDCEWDLLSSGRGHSFCEWKGTASYWDVTVGETVIRRRAWSYAQPTDEYAPLKDHLAFYASSFECRVDDELVVPQPGGFYGGWITSELEGPFKGDPGTEGW